MTKHNFIPHVHVPSQYIRLIFSKHIQELVSRDQISKELLVSFIQATYSSNATLRKTFKLPEAQQMAADMLSDDSTNNIYVESYRWVMTQSSLFKRRSIDAKDADALQLHLSTTIKDLNIKVEESPFNKLGITSMLTAMIIIMVIAQR